MPNFEKYTKNHLIVQFKNMNFMIYKVKYISIKQAKKIKVDALYLENRKPWDYFVIHLFDL